MYRRLRFPHPVLLPAAFLVLALWGAPAFAHFGMIIPDAPRATAQDRSLDFAFSFSHPFAGAGMELVKPRAAGVLARGKKTGLLESLAPATVMGEKAWSLEYEFKRPGAHTFYMEPEPYWEPAEDSFIIHYTKIVVPAFGGDAGWEEPVGLPTEIVPLTRPFGNWAGNTFVGRVLIDGTPAPGAEVEVELYNQGRFEAPSDYHETQVVVADDAGVFSFTCPRPGWWGFAALSTADYQLASPSGEQKDVETGAVLWTWMDPWTAR